MCNICDGLICPNCDPNPDHICDCMNPDCDGSCSSPLYYIVKVTGGECVGIFPYLYDAESFIESKSKLSNTDTYEIKAINPEDVHEYI